MRFVFLLMVLLLASTGSADSNSGGPEIKGYVLDRPYAPPIWDTGTEIGTFWLGAQHYWVGLNAGRHVGKCLFVSTDTCQQFIDIIGGIGGRDGYTHYLALPSLRFQYVNFPKRWATHFRVIAGGVYSIEPGANRMMGAFGAGVGLSTVLHEKVDLRVEARIGTTPIDSWSAVLISLQFKLDRVVADFAERLKDFGVGAAEKVSSDLGGVIKKAGEATGVKASPEEKPEEKTKD